MLESRAKTWLTLGGALTELTIACAFVYALTTLVGAAILFPGFLKETHAAILLFSYALSFFYLARCIENVGNLYLGNRHSMHSGPTGEANLLLLGVPLTTLGILLFAVSLGLLPFSADGQFGLTLTVMAIQCMSLGDTPLGHFNRSLLLIAVGTTFAGLGAFSSIMPGTLTGALRFLLGGLNFFGGALSLVNGYITRRVQGSATMPQDLRNIAVVQAGLAFLQLLFGLSNLLPAFYPKLLSGLFPSLVIAGIVFLNLGFKFEVQRRLTG